MAMETVVVKKPVILLSPGDWDGERGGGGGGLGGGRGGGAMGAYRSVFLPQCAQR